MLFAVLLALVSTEALAALPGADLAGCHTFAKMFDNTCANGSDGNPKAVADNSSW